MQHCSGHRGETVGEGRDVSGDDDGRLFVAAGRRNVGGDDGTAPGNSGCLQQADGLH